MESVKSSKRKRGAQAPEQPPEVQAPSCTKGVKTCAPSFTLIRRIDGPGWLATPEPGHTQPCITGARRSWSIDGIAVDDKGASPVVVPMTLELPPDFPSERGVYLSNLWYGHQQILIRHMGLDPRKRTLPGKLQNGWQPGTGLDGEQGMKLEVREGRLPHFLWSARAERNARAEGFDWGHAIGAPFIYAYKNEVRHPRPPGQGILLAFPTHSVDPDYPLDGWRRYAADLADFANAEGLRRNGVVACLHWRDYSNADARAAFDAADIGTNCLGQPFVSGFLDRLVDLIDLASVVTSDRVCTAGMYALWLDRPFVVHGAALRATHPELEMGPAGDPEWVAREFPELTRLGSQPRRAIAERELGLDFWKTREQLIATIFRDA